MGGGGVKEFPTPFMSTSWARPFRTQSEVLTRLRLLLITPLSSSLQAGARRTRGRPP